MSDQQKVFIFIALDCEAKPVTKFFDLKKVNESHPFTLYKNHHMVLSVTGVGKIAMAAAVAYTLAIFSPSPSPILLNIGIAGHQTHVIGKLLMAMKIIDEETRKSYYPAMICHDLPTTTVLKTLSKPSNQYSAECLYDMEASGFYQIAIKFSSNELIHCFKVVSDNQHSSIDNIQAKQVYQWINQQMVKIEWLLKQLLKLRESIEPMALEEYPEIIKQWHFTRTGQIRLKALLRQWKVLSIDPWLKSNDIKFSNSKALLKKLETDINQLEVNL